MSKQRGKDLTVKGQIQTGNAKVIAIVIVIVLLTFINLGLIDWYQNRLNYYNRNMKGVKDVTIAQYKWLNELSDKLNGGSDAVPEMDADKCSFAVWYEKAYGKADSALKTQMSKAEEIHRKMHEEGKEALAMAETDPEAAEAKLYGDIKTQAAAMLSGLKECEEFYEAKAERNQSLLISRLIWAIMTNFVLAIFAYCLARRVGNQLAKKISEPIEAVADWSEELSKGAAELGFDTTSHVKTDIVEINRMIQDFRSMADSIQENVNVVKKVADGDMTAYVNIRSSVDTLGKNLYRMVQNNDIMFAEITGIAEAVASGADNIARASSSLAESSNVQAGAVQEFSEAILQTGRFIEENNEKTRKAKITSDKIQEEVEASTEKMERLLEAMVGIREASERVSVMIGTIDDIADQTNLLALNAAIEAARAGEAGRGFAVVANEVKELAVKSSEAAEESKKLIGDTIEKTGFGDVISKETGETFRLIIDSIREITTITQEIADAGDIQQKHIQEVKRNISEITNAIEGNAAASRDAAAASDELNHNANELKAAMDKFNLRKRTPGKPYIPPEKKNDADFIRIAEENYQKALQEGRVNPDIA